MIDSFGTTGKPLTWSPPSFLKKKRTYSDSNLLLSKKILLIVSVFFFLKCQFIEDHFRYKHPAISLKDDPNLNMQECRHLRVINPKS